jgi:ABC-type sugar transport system ATPase subunit
MAEIQAISDRVTVLRDGRVVESGNTTDFSEAELNNLIAGRVLAHELSRGRRFGGGAERQEALRIDGLTNDRVAGVNLCLYRGEIYGLAGLVGSGRTELVRCIFGADRHARGAVSVDGKRVDIDSPRAAMSAGIALIPEDRRGQSLVPVMSVEQNFALASPTEFSRYGLVRGHLRRQSIWRYIAELGIRTRGPETVVRDLSGGNQQKVVIARWLQTGARVFLFDEPTRGIDVGAKGEIHELLRKLAAGGAAVLVISSELPELLALAHRMGVMRDGRLIHEIDDPTGLTEERLMQLASGGFAP